MPHRSIDKTTVNKVFFKSSAEFSQCDLGLRGPVFSGLCCEPRDLTSTDQVAELQDNTRNYQLTPGFISLYASEIKAMYGMLYF